MIPAAYTEDWQSHLLGSQPQVLICIDNSPTLYASPDSLQLVKEKVTTIFLKHATLAPHGKIVVALFNNSHEWRDVRKLEAIEPLFTEEYMLGGLFIENP